MKDLLLHLNVTVQLSGCIFLLVKKSTNKQFSRKLFKPYCIYQVVKAIALSLAFRAIVALLLHVLTIQFIKLYNCIETF